MTTFLGFLFVLCVAALIVTIIGLIADIVVHQRLKRLGLIDESDAVVLNQKIELLKKQVEALDEKIEQDRCR